MSTIFAVLGAGTQGLAAAYDLARSGAPTRLLIGDASLEQARRVADRVNALIGQTIAEPHPVDAGNPRSLDAFLAPVDVVACCLPYWLQPKALDAAIRTRTSMCDLDGEDLPTDGNLPHAEAALAAGITHIPDTGLAPGLVNSIGVHLMNQLDATESVQLYCGVLPQNPRPPLNYRLAFNVEGLIAEYDEPAIALRNGEVVTLEPLTEVEPVDFHGIPLEGFVTGGGVSTAPYTLQGRVANYEYKTLRFPGHAAQMRAFRGLGLWSDAPVDAEGTTVVPRALFRRLLADALAGPPDRDQCFVRGVAKGIKDGRPATLTIDIHDQEDPETGLTSMQRLTGFSIAIHAIAIAQGKLPKGALRYEEAMDPAEFLREIERRGVSVVTDAR